ncbi:hypothetical protein PSTT_15822 [Puccinia striiformis]|uniref:Protein kinase domain-containing protein n=1 Tax=Puccinia striiformis TaxID=27350 RepID=A0A2S4UFW1_9BASI|nr:hypothetical protein PSTT_15822 [Puccinia striiformis]
MKPENLLITTTGLIDYPHGSPYALPTAPPERDVAVILKIADFGLARETNSRPPYTEYVSTRWYRAPEVLLRARDYSNPVDMWALGAILVETVTLKPLFPGNGEMDQVHRICEIMGDPQHPYGLDDKGRLRGGGQWLGGVSLAKAVGFAFPDKVPIDFVQLFDTSNIPIQLIDCLHELLRYEPRARLTTAQCLSHSYFTDVAPRLIPASHSGISMFNSSLARGLPSPRPNSLYPASPEHLGTHQQHYMPVDLPSISPQIVPVSTLKLASLTQGLHTFLHHRIAATPWTRSCRTVNHLAIIIISIIIIIPTARHTLNHVDMFLPELQRQSLISIPLPASLHHLIPAGFLVILIIPALNSKLEVGRWPRSSPDLNLSNVLHPSGLVQIIAQRPLLRLAYHSTPRKLRRAEKAAKEEAKLEAQAKREAARRSAQERSRAVLQKQRLAQGSDILIHVNPEFGAPVGAPRKAVDKGKGRATLHPPMPQIVEDCSRTRNGQAPIASPASTGAPSFHTQSDRSVYYGDERQTRPEYSTEERRYSFNSSNTMDSDPGPRSQHLNLVRSPSHGSGYSRLSVASSPNLASLYRASTPASTASSLDHQLIANMAGLCADEQSDHPSNHLPNSNSNSNSTKTKNLHQWPKPPSNDKRGSDESSALSQSRSRSPSDPRYSPYAVPPMRTSLPSIANFDFPSGPPPQPPLPSPGHNAQAHERHLSISSGSPSILSHNSFPIGGRTPYSTTSPSNYHQPPLSQKSSTSSPPGAHSPNLVYDLTGTTMNNSDIHYHSHQQQQQQHAHHINNNEPISSVIVSVHNGSTSPSLSSDSTHPPQSTTYPKGVVPTSDEDLTAVTTNTTTTTTTPPVSINGKHSNRHSTCCPSSPNNIHPNHQLISFSQHLNPPQHLNPQHLLHQQHQHQPLHHQQQQQQQQQQQHQQQSLQQHQHLHHQLHYQHQLVDFSYLHNDNSQLDLDNDQHMNS